MYFGRYSNTIGQAIKISALYDLNLLDVGESLNQIICKYRCKTIQEAGDIFIKLYEKHQQEKN